jgi:hypothetical protein
MIMNKIKSSKARIARLQDDLESEQRNHAELLVALQNNIADELGTRVTIGRSGPIAANTSYDRDMILEQISTLRKVESSFTTIARILNNKGLKTLHGNAFSAAAVTQLYKSMELDAERRAPSQRSVIGPYSDF